MLRILFCLAFASLSFAAEIQNPQIKADFSIVKEQLESNLMALCSWDEKAITAENKNEYYTEILCSDGSYSYKFGTRLMYGHTTQVHAEAYAVSEGNKWFCVAEGPIENGVFHSEMACTQLE